jgi:hypothetical protein
MTLWERHFSLNHNRSQGKKLGEADLSDGRFQVASVRSASQEQIEEKALGDRKVIRWWGIVNESKEHHRAGC